MEIVLSQLKVSLVTLSVLLAPTPVYAEIQPWSMPTDAVNSALEAPRLNENDNYVISIIRQKCGDYEVDCDLAIKIADAESNFKNVPNHKYTDEKGKYTAYGVFQITRTTYKSFCGNPSERMDIEKNIDCGLHIMEVSGVQHWNESKSEWSKPKVES
jgi:hypothetical protein